MAIEYVALGTSPDELDHPIETHWRRPDKKTRLIALLKTLVSRPKHILASVTVLALLLALPLLHRQIYPPFTPLIPTENPYFHPGDIWKHNDAVSERLERCASMGLLQNTSMPLPEHLRKSPEEEEALIAQGCGTNETTIIILASLWSSEAYNGISTAGETIYAQSVISTLNAYNYSYMFSNLGWNNYEMWKTREIWEKHRWNVRLVLVDPLQADHCWENAPCLKTEENPGGIEAWRLVSFWYWDDPGNPLGPQFTLSPSPRNNNHFLSFSIEPTCRRLPYLPHEDRAYPPQAYLLTKQMRYFDPDNTFQGFFAWTIPGLGNIQRKLRIRITGGINRDNEDLSKEYDRAGLHNVGQLDKIGFYNQLARSFVLVGIGKPRISPSPFDAMCMGVPFINPILEWDKEDPENRTSWKAQQWWMTELQPPHVYHVHAFDFPALESAIQTAQLNPIESYIPEYMKFDYVCDRMAEVMEGDWRGKAEVILEERKRTGNGTVFVL